MSVEFWNLKKMVARDGIDKFARSEFGQLKAAPWVSHRDVANPPPTIK